MFHFIAVTINIAAIYYEKNERSSHMSSVTCVSDASVMFGHL